MGVSGFIHGRGVSGQGACVAWGACIGSVHGGGHVWQGDVRDMYAPLGRYYGYGIRSMSGRYASYWNAFLVYSNLLVASVHYIGVLGH